MSISGIILAGGTGSRLWPLTKIQNKHLIGVYDRPMLYFPLQTLIDAGVKDILIVAGKGQAGSFLELLGDGSEFGINLSYTVQEKPAGIADAIRLTKRFVGKDNFVTILADNIFGCENIFNFDDFKEGAKIFLKRVPDAHRFGVARIRYDVNEEKNKVVEIVEKPKFESTDNELIDKNGWGFAVTGLYLYNSNVFDIIDGLIPSDRGELEITDVNNMYIKEGKMDHQIIDGFWSDAGTFESLYRTSSFIRDNVRKRS